MSNHLWSNGSVFMWEMERHVHGYERTGISSGSCSDCVITVPMLLCQCYRTYTGNRKGVHYMEDAISFIFAVMAGVVCHLICKWMDGDKQPVTSLRC